MKRAQVNKLYSKLTPHEQAVLAFEAAARLDESEVETILDNVERKIYETLHADYIRRANGLQSLVGQYGIEYWKNRTLMMIACNMAEDGNVQAEETANRFFAKTVALELALVEVCERIRVDVTTIKTMVSCPPNEAKGYEFPEVDDELVKQYADMFAGLVST